MFVTIADLDRLKAQMYREVAKRFTSAATAYDGSKAATIMRTEADRLLLRARKLEEREG